MAVTVAVFIAAYMFGPIDYPFWANRGISAD